MTFPTKTDRAAIERANEELKSVRVTVTDYDEFRVNFIGGREGTAYYTSDLADAIDSAKLMDRGR